MSNYKYKKSHLYKWDFLFYGQWIGIELSPNYCKVAETRVNYFKTLEEIKEDQL